MAFFHFGKKKEEPKTTCSCGHSCTACQNQTDEASVKVLGGGCAKCHELADATRMALTELGMDSTIQHVTDFAVIATYGVMSTPALVIDGKVVSCGKVLKKDEVIALLQKSK